MDDWPNDLLGVPTDSPMAAAVALAELRALHIGDVERGTKSATIRTMNDLATLLNVRLSVLLAEAEESLASGVKERTRPTRSLR
jgi:hypothetical protein